MIPVPGTVPVLYSKPVQYPVQNRLTGYVTGYVPRIPGYSSAVPYPRENCSNSSTRQYPVPGSRKRYIAHASLPGSTTGTVRVLYGYSCTRGVPIVYEYEYTQNVLRLLQLVQIIPSGPPKRNPRPPLKGLEPLRVFDDGIKSGAAREPSEVRGMV